MAESWQSPAGFVEVESAIEDVRVFAPAPQPEEAPSPESFPCPACGATLEFVPSAGAITCRHCGHVGEPPARPIGRAAEELEFRVGILERARHGWGAPRRELICETCGGSLTLPEGELTARCAFCASNRVVLGQADSDRLRPAYLVPFKNERSEVVERLRQWLGQGWMHPGRLVRAAAGANLVGIYAPFWTFDARVTAKWEAEVSYTRTETRFEGGELKVRVVVEWRHESGREEQVVDDRVTSGTRRLTPELLDRISSFDLDDLVEYDPSYLAGWRAQTYDVGLEAAWDAARAVIRERVRRACRKQTGGKQIRNFVIVADFDDERWRHVLLPVWIVAYRFGNQSHQVLVNGQTGKLAGRKPVAWSRVWGAALMWLAPGLLTALFGSLFGDGSGAGLLGILLFGAGLFGAARIFKKARALESGG